MQLLIGLGGNLGDVAEAFIRARTALAEAGSVRAVSSLYRTAPVGPPQPAFLNAALLLDAAIPPLQLLDLVQSIELAAGRERDRGARWGPRPLDLDLLLAAGAVHSGPRLRLPHPRLADRAFAVVPAAEIAPDWIHQVTGRRVGDLAARLTRPGDGLIERLGPWGSRTPPR